jgi:phage tail-like protein
MGWLGQYHDKEDLTLMSDSQSGYLRYLPQILRDGEAAADFLNGYLSVVEALLSGRDDVPPEQSVRSLEGMIASAPDLFDPALTPVQSASPGEAAQSPFLDYLARWVALTFDQNWPLDKRREWLRRVVPLYKRRGTLAGLNEYLSMFVGSQAKIDEPPGGFLLGRFRLPGGEEVKGSSTVGEDTYIAGAPAYYFRVRINYGFPQDIADPAGLSAEPFNIDVWRNIQTGTRAIIDLEKPAHTYYSLDARTPGIILASRSTVGRDTLIWQNSKPV